MTRLWAHRGASRIEPENTLPAFQAAISLGAHGVEFDVQRSADGMLVVIHDETVDRTTNGTGPVAGLDWGQLARLDASNGQQAAGVAIPRLDDVLELLASSGLEVNIELKNSIQAYPGLEPQVLAAVAASGLDNEQVIYSSFNHRSLRLLHTLAPQARIGVLYAQQLVDPVGYARGFGASALHPMAQVVLPGDVDDAHGAGLAINVWTVDDPELASRLAADGVDALITNEPAHLLGPGEPGNSAGPAAVE